MPEARSDDDLARFLTLGDTAEILAIGVLEATELVQSGELPAIRVGGSWRVERVVLEAFIEGQYEESRRMALWRESDFGNIPELSGGRILRPQPRDEDEA